MIMTNGLTTKSAASVYSKLYKSILERVLSDMFRGALIVPYTGSYPRFIYT